MFIVLKHNTESLKLLWKYAFSSKYVDVYSKFDNIDKIVWNDERIHVEKWWRRKFSSESNAPPSLLPYRVGFSSLALSLQERERENACKVTKQATPPAQLNNSSERTYYVAMCRRHRRILFCLPARVRNYYYKSILYTYSQYTAVARERPWLIRRYIAPPRPVTTFTINTYIQK
jgi:hypothetical protein